MIRNTFMNTKLELIKLFCIHDTMRISNKG